MIHFKATRGRAAPVINERKVSPPSPVTARFSSSPQEGSGCLFIGFVRLFASSETSFQRVWQPERKPSLLRDQVGAALIVHEETFISEPSPETFSCGGKPRTLRFLLSPEFGTFFSPRTLSEAIFTKVFHGDSDSKAFACNEGDLGSIPGLGRSLGAGNSTHSSILAWRIPWTEEPGGLQSMEVSKSQN